ncbi:MAG TPA: PQQ-binding-like beta-propeller repeat protein [Bacteroidales bacterium]|nr:PQQ-binding-like beta-propeller repeat protein [Bacteroidales bacterium]
MKIDITDKDIHILKVISQTAGAFTLIVALTMLFSFVQLKTINPLDNPALLKVKEQYDRDPTNTAIAEQVRAMDLMARKAYFSSKWQVQTGSYLLIAGAAIFIFCQWLIAGREKLIPVIPDVKPVAGQRQKNARKYLSWAAMVIFLAAIGSSFIMRSELPDTGDKSGKNNDSENKAVASSDFVPDATNYPFFRGQDGRANAGGKSYPTQWDGAAGKNIEWKTEIPLPGKNSPVIWDDKLFLTGSDGKTCEVYCLDKKSGKILWTVPVTGIAGEPSETPQMDQENGLTTSTAAVNKKYVAAVFANGDLVCLDHDGKTIWSKNIGIPSNTYGYSSSLLIYDKLLLLQFDSDAKLSLLGIDLETGEVKWDTPRKGRPVWSSPVLAVFDGKPQVVINGNPFVSGFDAVTGEELWSVEAMSGDVAPSAAVNSTMAYAVTDYAKLAAIKGGTGAALAWEDNTFTPDVSSPVANDEFLFLATGTGDVACYNAQKGDTLWTHYFTDQFYASPVIAAGNVYFLDRTGKMHVVKAAEKFQLVAESPLGERADCTPAFSDKKIYIRGEKNLYCISE